MDKVTCAFFKQFVNRNGLQKRSEFRWVCLEKSSVFYVYISPELVHVILIGIHKNACMLICYCTESEAQTNSWTYS